MGSGRIGTRLDTGPARYARLDDPMDCYDRSSSGAGAGASAAGSPPNATASPGSPAPAVSVPEHQQAATVHGGVLSRLRWNGGRRTGSLALFLEGLLQAAEPVGNAGAGVGSAVDPFRQLTHTWPRSTQAGQRSTANAQRIMRSSQGGRVCLCVGVRAGGRRRTELATHGVAEVAAVPLQHVYPCVLRFSSLRSVTAGGIQANRKPKEQGLFLGTYHSPRPSIHPQAAPAFCPRTCAHRQSLVRRTLSPEAAAKYARPADGGAAHIDLFPECMHVAQRRQSCQPPTACSSSSSPAAHPAPLAQSIS